MNLLYLHQYFATPSSNAGTRSYEIAKRLVKNGNNVTFVTSSAFLSNDYDLKNGWNYLEIDGIKLNVLHLPYSNRDSYYSRIYKFINFSVRSTFKSLSVKSDLVFATSTPLTIAIPAVIYSKLKRVPMVFEVRDLWPELPIAIGAIKNPLLIRLSQLLEKFAYNNAKHIIALSPGMRDGVHKSGVSLQNITLASNSCDTELFDVDPEVGRNYALSELGFLKGRKLVAYTGTFGAINDVEYIVKLAARAKEVAPNICFVAVGDGMEKQKVIDAASECRVLNNNLFILEPIRKTEVVKLLSSSDLALSLFGPTKEMWHNSANKLFDALASQTPVAINYGGWQKDFIEDSGCGIVLDSKDINSSVDKITSLLNSKEQYASAVSACRKLSYGDFSRDTMAQRLEKVLVGALNDKT